MLFDRSKRLLPFATVHFEQAKDTFTASALTQKQLGEQILANYPYKNLFFAVKITGRFSKTIQLPSMCLQTDQGLTFLGSRVDRLDFHIFPYILYLDQCN